MFLHKKYKQIDYYYIGKIPNLQNMYLKKCPNMFQKLHFTILKKCQKSDIILWNLYTTYIHKMKLFNVKINVDLCKFLEVKV